MKNIAVIGAGTMGNGIAHTFAQFDYRVQLIDVSEEALKRGIATIEKISTEWWPKKPLQSNKSNKL